MPSAGGNVDFEPEAGSVTPAATASERRSGGQALVEGLRGKGDFAMTTDQVLALMRGPAADEDAPSRNLPSA